MTPEQLQQHNEMYAFIQSLKRTDLIPLDVEKSFGYRLKKLFPVRSEIQILSVSSKSATSENRTVDEAGSATYSVLKAPDRFLDVVDDAGTTTHIPVYD